MGELLIYGATGYTGAMAAEHARDLGLKDNSEVDHKSSDGSMSPKGCDVTDAIRRKYE